MDQQATRHKTVVRYRIRDLMREQEVTLRMRMTVGEVDIENGPTFMISRTGLDLFVSANGSTLEAVVSLEDLVEHMAKALAAALKDTTKNEEGV